MLGPKKKKKEREKLGVFLLGGRGQCQKRREKRTAVGKKKKGGQTIFGVLIWRRNRVEYRKKKEGQGHLSYEKQLVMGRQQPIERARAGEQTCGGTL